MIKRLMQRFIIEVPEDFSVCVFDCHRAECTKIDWGECELLRTAALRGNCMPASSISQTINKNIPCTTILESVIPYPESG